MNLDQQQMPFERDLKTIMEPSMQMKYKLIRSVIFYSVGLSNKRGTHLSLISLVSHVMWDWSEREREPLWLPAAQLFVAAQCHCHSPAILMCSFLSASINVSLGRHTCKWIGVQACKIGKRGNASFMFQVYMDTWKAKQEWKIFFIFSSRLALMKMSSDFSFEMLFSYPKGARLES